MKMSLIIADISDLCIPLIHRTDPVMKKTKCAAQQVNVVSNDTCRI